MEDNLEKQKSYDETNIRSINSLINTSLTKKQDNLSKLKSVKPKGRDGTRSMSVKTVDDGTLNTYVQSLNNFVKGSMVTKDTYDLKYIPQVLKINEECDTQKVIIQNKLDLEYPIKKL